MWVCSSPKRQRLASLLFFTHTVKYRPVVKTDRQKKQRKKEDADERARENENMKDVLLILYISQIKVSSNKYPFILPGVCRSLRQR